MESRDTEEKVEAESHAVPATTPEQQEEFKIDLPKWQLLTITASISSGLFLSLLDTTIVATSLFTIGQDLQSLDSVTWVALAYTLSYLGCAVIFARLADVLGRRNGYLSAYVIFLVFSLGCGFAQTLQQLIVCRVFQGIGGSGLYSLTFVIASELASPQQGQWIGALVGGVVAIAGVLGPVLGGVITHYTTWRWVFWINVPVGIVPLVLFAVVWPKPHQLRPIQKVSINRIDFVGCVLIIAASVLVVFSLQQAGLQPNVWRKPIFLGPLIAGCLCWLLLLAWEFTVAHNGGGAMATMFPLRLMKRRVYMAFVISTLLSGFPYFLVIFSLPLRLQVVNGKSSIFAGVTLLPLLCCVALGSVISGGANKAWNNTFFTLFAGSCLMLIGTGLFSRLETQVAVQPSIYGLQVLVGLGFGLVVSTVSLGASLESEVRDNTVAQGIIAQVRVLGGSIGIAASTTILGVIQRRQLSELVTPHQLATLQESAKEFTPLQLAAVRGVYAQAFREDMRVCAVVAGICVLCTLGAWRRERRGVDEIRVEAHREEGRRLRGLSGRTGAVS